MDLNNVNNGVHLSQKMCIARSLDYILKIVDCFEATPISERDFLSTKTQNTRNPILLQTNFRMSAPKITKKNDYVLDSELLIVAWLITCFIP